MQAMSCNALLAMAMACLLAGCGPGSGDADMSAPPVATVDDEPISRGLLDAYLSDQGIQEPTPEQRGEALQNLIRLQSVVNYTERINFTDEADVQARLALAHKRRLFDLYTRHYAEQNPIDNGDLRSAYNQRVQAAGGREYKLRIVVYPDEQAAQAAILSLKQDRSFDDLVEQARAAGHPVREPGWIDLGGFPRDYAKTLKQLEPGGHAPVPMQGPEGWMVVNLQDSRPFQPPSFEQVREGIRRSLEQERVKAWVETLEKKAEVEMNNVETVGE